jgi:hypothetical protein
MYQAPRVSISPLRRRRRNSRQLKKLRYVIFVSGCYAIVLTVAYSRQLRKIRHLPRRPRQSEVVPKPKR